MMLSGLLLKEQKVEMLEFIQFDPKVTGIVGSFVWFRLTSLQRKLEPTSYEYSHGGSPVMETFSCSNIFDKFNQS